MRSFLLSTTSLLFASMVGMSGTASVSAVNFSDPDVLPIIASCGSNNSMSSSTDFALCYEESVKAPIFRSDAVALFGEMRNLTADESASYQDMKRRMGKSIELDIFSL